MPLTTKALFFFLSPFVSYTIFGHSMEPTFSEGQRVFVQKKWFFCHLQKGDIIVFKDPRKNRMLIKRIQKIRKNRIFVVGDNTKHSTDSRQFGSIKRKDTIGKVIAA